MSVILFICHTDSMLKAPVRNYALDVDDDILSCELKGAFHM